ncbi:MAG: polysaccharide deacetylase family protein [Xanthomonadales bacterium]|nr:polysaccharide deacetylase family protein [Xanthomonadales bacterium]
MILYGHRVSDNDEGYMQGLRPQWLDQQLSYLGRHYQFISLDTLLHCYEKRQPVPEKSVVLTFDDGFRDNLDNALPVLEKHGAPATIFVVTGALTNGDLPWSQRLGYLFQNTTRDQVHHRLTGPEPAPLATPAQRKAAYQRCKPALAAMLWQQRDQSLAELASLLDVDPPRDRMLNWTQARALQAQGIGIGAHTWSHALLASIPPAEASWEMRKSREDLREHLGIEQPSFCFPAGSTNAQLQAHAAELGFRSAFLPGRPIRMNTLANADPFSLARVGLPDAPAWQLEAELDGPFHGLRKLLGRLPADPRPA